MLHTNKSVVPGSWIKEHDEKESHLFLSKEQEDDSGPLAKQMEDMHFNIPDDIQPNHSRLQVHKPRNSRSDELSAIDQISLQGGHLVARSEASSQWEIPDPSKLQIPDKSLVVIFVENPTVSAGASAGDGDDSLFISVKGTHACRKMKEAFRNLAFPTKKYWKIYEWLLVAYAMENGTSAFKWDVDYVAWKEFSDAMMTMKGPIWEKSLSADLLCGGLDFSCDF
ncbi:hypothetical protein AX14_011811, partial [Amanita brunnescens Koide BX004]